MPWWRGAAIYQVYPRSFADASGDGVGESRRPAPPARTRRRARRSTRCGLSPFYRSPQADFGYDVADHTDVDPLFGTLADADALVGEAHRLGLRVIVDFVPGHTSSAHAWFRDSRTSRDGERADWYVWADAKPDGTAPNNWLSFFGGPAWQWEPRRGAVLPAPLPPRAAEPGSDGARGDRGPARRRGVLARAGCRRPAPGRAADRRARSAAARQSRAEERRGRGRHGRQRGEPDTAPVPGSQASTSRT